MTTNLCDVVFFIQKHAYVLAPEDYCHSVSQIRCIFILFISR